jgi:hypothetical protein
MNGIMTGLPLNHVLAVIERNLLRLSVCLAARQESGQSGLPFLFRFDFFRCAVYRVQQVRNIGAVLLTLFERSVEVLGYSSVLKLGIVSLDLHREQDIIPRKIMKCEKGNKKPMNRKTKQLNNRRTKEKKKREGKNT